MDIASIIGVAGGFASLIFAVLGSGGGLGGLFGSGNTAAFGSRSQTVITKTTYVLVTLFFVTTFAVAFLTRAPAVGNLQEAAKQVQQTTENDNNGAYWLDEQKTEQSASEPAQMSPVQDGE